MPYIKQENRNRIDSGSPPRDEGELAYTIYRLAVNYMRRVGVKFSTLNAVVGVLDNVKDEFKRRKLNPHEDVKIAENGDI